MTGRCNRGLCLGNVFGIHLSHPVPTALTQSLRVCRPIWQPVLRATSSPISRALCTDPNSPPSCPVISSLNRSMAFQCPTG